MSKPPTICRCGGLVYREVCTGCGPRPKRTGWRSDRERGTRQERGYDQRWLDLRKMKLARNPVCEVCGITEADEVHHVMAFSGLRDPLRLRLDNLQSLCMGCHNEITTRRSSMTTRIGTYPPA